MSAHSILAKPFKLHKKDLSKIIQGIREKANNIVNYEKKKNNNDDNEKKMQEQVLIITTILQTKAIGNVKTSNLSL
jgi:hypothetical protein